LRPACRAYHQVQGTIEEALVGVLETETETETTEIEIEVAVDLHEEFYLAKFGKVRSLEQVRFISGEQFCRLRGKSNYATDTIVECILLVKEFL